MARPSRSGPGSSPQTRSSSRRRTPSPAGLAYGLRARRAGLVGLAALVLGGCMVGPDYMKPSVPMTPAYKETDGWKAAEPSDHLPRGQWWAIFSDPELHALQDEVATANQNLQIAEARLSEARAMVRFNRA